MPLPKDLHASADSLAARTITCTSLSSFGTVIELYIAVIIKESATDNVEVRINVNRPKKLTPLAILVTGRPQYGTNI